MTLSRHPFSILRPFLSVLALAGPITGAAADAAEAVRDLRIDDQTRFWREGGYQGLVPSIHLPTTHGAGDLIHVWLRLPPGGRIDARHLEDQDRYTLVFPPGTRADRVEYYRTVRCGDEPARLESQGGGERFVCPGDRVPMGYRDVKAALAAAHPYTERLCEVRRYLYGHMTRDAREAFAPAFRVCGIGLDGE